MSKKGILLFLGAVLTLSMGACTEDANMHNIGNDKVSINRIKENQRYQESGTVKDTLQDKQETKKGNAAQKEKDAE